MDTISEFLQKLFDTNDFTPRWVCGRWSDFHGWLYICSNIAVWAAYFTIPILLLYLIRKRKDVPFQKIFIWFILFILFCGSTHLFDAIMFWIPAYRLNAIMLSITAVVSWGTVFVLSKALPRAFEFKSPKQLQIIIDEKTKELEIANIKLKESEEFFRTLVNNNPDVITRVGYDLKYKFVNDSILKFSKKNASDFIGKTPIEVTTDKTVGTEFFMNIQKSLTTGKVVAYETQTTMGGNELRHYDVQIIPILSAVNRVEDVLTVTKDITQTKNTEFTLRQNVEELQRLSHRLAYKKKILEDFAYIVSHNLRSPVGNLTALLNLYEEESNPQQKEFLVSKIKQVSERLSSTVFDLTEVVKIRQNTDIEKQHLHFETVLKNQMESISAQILETQASITYDFYDAEYIDFPKVYLESIILNLLTNAIKYRHPDRKPFVHFKTYIGEKDNLLLSCQDNGLGIDLKKHGHKIFGLHKTFHNHPDSKGVGLFITKNQIESLGGTIMVESEPDKGTKFIVSFSKS